MERRLAAILALDAVGYSRLMTVDEAGTHAMLKAHRDELVVPKIDLHGGRLVKLTGDGALVEFKSVVRAVDCAIEIQRAMADRNTDLAPDNQIVFRIGINLGDVIVEDDDIYGDGVNIASRLETIANPGGLTISSSVHDYLDQKLSSQFSDGGEQSLKNISRPVSVWRWMPNQQAVVAPAHRESLGTAKAVRGARPRLLVRPFWGLGTDDNSDSLGQGICEELTTTLARVQTLDVLASLSRNLFHDRTAAFSEFGKALGVDYAIEGTFRKEGDRIRIHAKLVDVESQTVIWTDRFDGEILDVFSFQDDLVERIVAAVQPKLRSVRAEFSRRKRPEEARAVDLYLQARQLIYRGTKSDYAEAGELMRRALVLDPDFALGYALLSYSITRNYSAQWAAYDETSVDEALELARRAISISENDPEIILLSAYTSAFHQGVDRLISIGTIHDAILHMPMTADMITVAGWTLIMLGDAEKAYDLFSRGVRLTSHDASISMMKAGKGASLFFIGNSREALIHLEEARSANPRYPLPYRYMAVCHFEVGDVEKARHWLSTAIGLTPGMSLAAIRTNLRSFRHPRTAIYLEALDALGLPE